MPSNWITRKENKIKKKEISSRFQIPISFSDILINRNINTEKEYSDYIKPPIKSLLDPFEILNMDKAVNKIVSMDRKQTILLYGSDNIDSIICVSILYSFFKELNMDVEYYIAINSIEGYDISTKGINYCKYIDSRLMIICNSNYNNLNRNEFFYKSLDIELLLIDSQKYSYNKDNFYTILNPNQDECQYLQKNICTSIIGFKLIQAIFKKNDYDLKKIVKFCDLITIAISSLNLPIVYDNHFITYYGLKVIKSNKNHRMKYFFNDNNDELLDLKKIITIIKTSTKIGDSVRFIKLVTSKKTVYIKQLSNDLINEYNKKIKNIELIMDELIYNLRENNDLNNEILFYNNNNNWSHDLILIILENFFYFFKKPIILTTTKNNDLICNGYGNHRFNFNFIVNLFKDKLKGYFYDKKNIGFRLSKTNHKKFVDRFLNYTKKYEKKLDIKSNLNIESELKINNISDEFIRLLEPFNTSIDPPIFISKNINIVGMPELIGKNYSILKFKIKEDINAIGYNMEHQYQRLINNKKIDIIYNIKSSLLKNNTIQLNIIDIK